MTEIQKQKDPSSDDKSECEILLIINRSNRAKSEEEKNI